MNLRRFTRRGAGTTLGTAAIALALAAGCSSSDAPNANAPPTQVEAQRVEAQVADEAEPVAVADDTVTPTDAPADTRTQRPGASSEAAARLKSWGVVHDFLGDQVVAGKAVSATEAIAITRGNHVGVTTDAGVSWGFQQHDTGTVLAVAGAPGGPFVATGKAGYMAFSADGKAWHALPRYTDDDLTSVAVGDAGVVAVGKRGTWVRFDKAGKIGATDVLPDKFKARDVAVIGGQLVAWSGKTAYGTLDGTVWAKLDAAPTLPDARKAATSRGFCAIGAVGKARGVVCEVKGQAWGLSAREAVVDDKKMVSFTRDAGETWQIAELPFKGLEGVVGNAGGPTFAFGKGGGLATTRDGAAWTEVAVNATKTLRAGIVDNQMVLIVGDGGTIVRSANGGETWEVVPSPVNKTLKQIVKLDGRYVVPTGGKAGIESADGATWTEIADPEVVAAIEAPARPGTCEGRMPAAGEVCKLSRAISSPLGLPNAKAMHFEGDHGLAMGDNGMVAFTPDGGATWKARSGFSLRGLTVFDVAGDAVVAAAGKSVIVSNDGGKRFAEAQLPKGAGKLEASLLKADGTVFLVGQGGTILRSSGALTDWVLLEAAPKDRTAFVGVWDVNGALYAAGKRGELFRSDSNGSSWVEIATGVTDPIQAITGEGSTVLAATRTGRKGGNLILRSEDGGKHFVVLHEVSDTGPIARFELKDGKLLYDNRVSADHGATWNKSDDYWRGSMDIGGGVRVALSPNRYSRDTLYVIGADKDDYTIVDSVVSRGGALRCDAASGCWMLDGGQVYRPL